MSHLTVETEEAIVWSGASLRRASAIARACGGTIYDRHEDEAAERYYRQRARIAGYVAFDERGVVVYQGPRRNAARCVARSHRGWWAKNTDEAYRRRPFHCPFPRS